MKKAARLVVVAVQQDSVGWIYNVSTRVGNRDNKCNNQSPMICTFLHHVFLLLKFLLVLLIRLIVR